MFILKGFKAACFGSTMLLLDQNCKVRKQASSYGQQSHGQTKTTAIPFGQWEKGVITTVIYGEITGVCATLWMILKCNRLTDITFSVPALQFLWSWSCPGDAQEQWDSRAVPHEKFLVGSYWLQESKFWQFYMGQVTKLRLSCYLVLLSFDSKTR